jgi:hypothetical protein
VHRACDHVITVLTERRREGELGATRFVASRRQPPRHGVSAQWACAISAVQCYVLSPAVVSSTSTTAPVKSVVTDIQYSTVQCTLSTLLAGCLWVRVARPKAFQVAMGSWKNDERYGFQALLYVVLQSLVRFPFRSCLFA